MKEKRHTTLTEQDLKNLIDGLTKPIANELVKPENIDMFAKCFEARWIDYMDKGIGRGVRSLAKKGAILILSALSAYGMYKGINWK